MNCPVCAGKLGTVMTRADCEQVYRKRKCRDCGRIVYTAETESEEARAAIRRLWSGNEK